MLTRIATTMIANNVRMIELFTSLKVCRRVICVCEQTRYIHPYMHTCTVNACINTYMHTYRHWDTFLLTISCIHPCTHKLMHTSSVFAYGRCAGPHFERKDRLHCITYRRFDRFVESHTAVRSRLQSQRLSCPPALFSRTFPHRLILLCNLKCLIGHPCRSA